MIEFTARALADIEAQVAHYEAISPAVRSRWSAAFRQAVSHAEEYPERYPLTGVFGARRTPFRFGAQTFLIDYRIEPDRIVVLRVWHGRQRRPG